MFKEATLYRVQEQRVKGGIFVACCNVLKLYTFMFSVEISLVVQVLKQAGISCNREQLVCVCTVAKEADSA